MANTDVTHLPSLVFLTPAFILEVDQTRQFNPSVIPGPDGILGTADDLPANADPVGRSPRPAGHPQQPGDAGPDTNYLQYTGAEHVVLGGTAGQRHPHRQHRRRHLYGDAGNDRLEGGFGNDDHQRRRRRRHHHRHRRRRRHPRRRRQRRHPGRPRHQPDPGRAGQGLHRHRRGLLGDLRRHGQRLHPGRQAERVPQRQRGQRLDRTADCRTAPPATTSTPSA